MKEIFFASCFFAVAVIIFLFVGGFEAAAPTAPPQPAAVRIVTSLYPYAYLARAIGGERVDVTLLTDGVEPHDFEPSPKDVQKINESHLFIINGGGVEPWADDLVKELEARGVRVLRIEDVVSAAIAEKMKYDPHVWLDAEIMAEVANKLSLQFELLEPASAGIFKENMARVVNELTVVDTEFKQGLSSCASRKIIVSHDAFGYLAERYNLEQLSIAGISPESEPSPRHLANLAALIKKEKIPYVFFETLVSPKLAQTLAKEAGAQTLVLNPLEGVTPEEKEAGADYVSVMRENLANLKTALLCK